MRKRGFLSLAECTKEKKSMPVAQRYLLPLLPSWMSYWLIVRHLPKAHVVATWSPGCCCWEIVDICGVYWVAMGCDGWCKPHNFHPSSSLSLPILMPSFWLSMSYLSMVSTHHIAQHGSSQCALPFIDSNLQNYAVMNCAILMRS